MPAESRFAAICFLEGAMEIFTCEGCGQLLFFENSSCTRCGSTLAYLPDRDDVCALEPVDDKLFQVVGEDDGPRYRLCRNYSDHAVCNWAVPADDPHELCTSCRLTAVIPNLQRDGALEAWGTIEAAKRRLIWGLRHLGLPIIGREEDPERGVVFHLLSDADSPGEKKVLTGHQDGQIVLNIAEADQLERERRREQLGEPYRTLLGHFRHESGHFYWDQLIALGPHLEAYRSLFGDEQADYDAALKRYYEHGAPANWQEAFVSAYATSHPWEDWAETWAHYLHIVGTLETMAAVGLDVGRADPDSPVQKVLHSRGISAGTPFDSMIDRWLALSFALNAMSRSLGHGNVYPFVLSETLIAKLRFVDLVVDQSARQEVG